LTPFFTIIIPVKAINDYVRETVSYIQNLSSKSWELIILPNQPEPQEWSDERIQIVPSGLVGPAKKRDMGAELARGKILVFLDDDSYPKSNLLNIAEYYFADGNVVALGGPAITPPHDTFWQRVSGTVFLSKFSGGVPERYLPTGRVREICDWPSVNLMVRKADFLAIGGFNSLYWPGEDTKLCLDLVMKTKKTILYIPEMIVWHHRRASLAAHLRQIGGYGLHRGYFAKQYPETSRKLVYFIPSCFVLFIALSFFIGFLPMPLKILIAIGWGVYGLAMGKALYDFLAHEKMTVSLCALWYTFFTHVVYGIRFLQGFVFTKHLVSTLR
jgi:GT2 family glycosyltransferase